MNDDEMLPPDLPKQIQDYVIIKSLGSGSFATVYLAQHTTTQTLVALKCISKSNLRNPQEFEQLRREILIMRDMDHPFIISFYELVDDNSNFYIAMEVAENGNLLNYITTNKGLQEQQARRIFCQIVAALRYLHIEQNVVHRDLKPENVLLDTYCNIRLVDFGFSRTFRKDDPFVQTTCGSPAYIAPEIIKQKPYTTTADIWSLGVILYVMTVGVLPFDDDNITMLLQKIVSEKPVIPNSLSPHLKSLLTRLLVKEPLARITLPEIMNHPWITEFEDAKLFNEDFGLINSLKVVIPRSLDSSVLSEMTVLGYETHGLLRELQAAVVNKRTAVYKMLRNQRIIDQIHSWQITRASKTKVRATRNVPALNGTAKTIFERGKVRLVVKRKKKLSTPKL